MADVVRPKSDATYEDAELFYTDAMSRQNQRSTPAWPLAVLVCGASLLVAQTATAPRRGGNPEAANLKNPVAATPESLSAGKRFYTQFCANCHGPVGKGDGTTAGADQPSDLTDGVWDYGASDGEVFVVIHNGLTGKDMGGYAGRISDHDIWSVVNFIRTLSRVQGQK